MRYASGDRKEFGHSYTGIIHLPILFMFPNSLGIVPVKRLSPTITLSKCSTTVFISVRSVPSASRVS